MQCLSSLKFLFHAYIIPVIYSCTLTGNHSVCAVFLCILQQKIVSLTCTESFLQHTLLHMQFSYNYNLRKITFYCEWNFCAFQSLFKFAVPELLTTVNYGDVGSHPAGQTEFCWKKLIDCGDEEEERGSKRFYLIARGEADRGIFEITLMVFYLCAEKDPGNSLAFMLVPLR